MLWTLFVSCFILLYLRSTFYAYRELWTIRIWTKRHPNSWESLFSGAENSSKRVKLEAEWNNFKYEPSDWSKDYQAMPSPTTTSTEWALQRFLRQKESYYRSYPFLLQVAEVCLYMAVSNAWPERGTSALKHLKTCLRISLKKEMLESLLHISINVPPVKESEAVINKAVPLWKGKKHRRKLPRSSRLQHKG